MEKPKPPDSRIDWSYVAGFFDGEGHCSLHANRGHRSIGGSGCPCAHFSQKTPRVLSSIQAFLARNEIRSRLYRWGRRENEYYDLGILTSQVTEFLAHILPYLIVKKVVAQDIIRFRQFYPPISFKRGGQLGIEARKSNE